MEKGKLYRKANKTFEPCHEKNLFILYANNKCADQPAHPRSLISAFVVRYPYSIIPLVSISEIASLYLAAVAEQAGLSLPWSQTPKTGFLMTWLIFYHNNFHFIQVQDPCSPNPCVHGQCSQSGSTFSCSCNSGYTGPTCSQGIG